MIKLSSLQQKHINLLPRKGDKVPEWVYYLPSYPRTKYYDVKLTILKYYDIKSIPFMLHDKGTREERKRRQYSRNGDHLHLGYFL